MATANELSNLQCLKAKSAEKPYRLSDSGGLFLLVTTTGGKLWRWKYRIDGKERLMAFGKYPDVTLAQARLFHAKARAKLAAGIDPMAERQEAKQEKRAALAEKKQKATTDPTFGNLARKWFDWWKTDKNQRYVAKAEHRIESDVIQQLGKMRPEDIKRMDIVNAIKATDGRGARDVAQRNLQMIRQIFNWGLNNGYLDENSANPAASIRSGDVLSKTVKSHFARVSLAEVPAMVQALDRYTGHAVTCLTMKLLSLTFLRTTELISGRWKEIDWEQKQWIIPAERMKGRREEKRVHSVPLATQTLAALKQLYAITGDGEYLFPGAGGSKTMSNNTILQALKRLGYKGKMTGHGWRGIASTYLHEKGFNHLHIETQLAHCSGAGDQVAAVYNYALYLDPRRKMMQHWADFLDECRDNAGQEKYAA